jgi:hypothetical protein
MVATEVQPGGVALALEMIAASTIFCDSIAFKQNYFGELIYGFILCACETHYTE